LLQYLGRGIAEPKGLFSPLPLGKFPAQIGIREFLFLCFVEGLLQGQCFVVDEAAATGEAPYFSLLLSVGSQFKFEGLAPRHDAPYSAETSGGERSFSKATGGFYPRPEAAGLYAVSGKRIEQPVVN
jgi:hypothetical protein